MSASRNQKQDGHPYGCPSRRTGPNLEENLRPRSNRCRFARRYRFLFFFAVRLLLWLAALADVNAALEERAIFNRDARRDHIAGQRAITPDIYAITCGQIASHFSQHHDFARVDVRRNDSIAAHGYTIARKIDGSFHASVDIKRFGTGHLALDHERLADGRLVRSGGRYRPRRCRWFARHDGCTGHRRSWALRLSWPAWGLRLIRRLPHGLHGPFLCWD